MARAGRTPGGVPRFLAQTASSGPAVQTSIVLSNPIFGTAGVSHPIGQVTAATARAINFTAPSNINVVAVDLNFTKVGTPTDNITVGIYATTSSVNGPIPTGSALANTTTILNGASITGAVTWYTFAFASLALNSATTYAIVIGRSGAVDVSNYYQLSTDDVNASGIRSDYNGSTWTCISSTFTPGFNLWANAVSTSTYSLTANPGSYAATGSLAALLHKWILSAGVGSYALTGTNAALGKVAFLRPDGDVSAGSWTNETGGTSNIYQSIDETPFSDLDYVQSPDAADASFVVRLYDGATQIASWTDAAPSTTFSTVDQLLTSPQVAAISSFSNLFVEFDDGNSNVFRTSLSNPAAGAVAPVTLRYRYKKAVSSSLDTSTTAWITAVTSAGGSVSSTQQTNVDTLIKALKTAPNGNLFSILDRFWLFGGESDVHQANIDIINLGTHTVHGTPTLSAKGYTGNGSTDYIDSNFNPFTAGGHFAQNSACYGGFVANNRFIGQQYVMMGAAGSSYIYLRPLDGGGNLEGGLNDNSFNSSGPSTNARGHWTVSRTSSGFIVFYKAGASVYSPAATSAAVPNANIYILAYNSGGPANNTPDQISCAYLGGGLTASQAADFDTAVAAYMTAWAI
jgi:hypothetical protein